MDDPVGKVEHIGRETMKKLADLRVAALESGLPEVASALDDRTAKIETGVIWYTPCTLPCAAAAAVLCVPVT